MVLPQVVSLGEQEDLKPTSMDNCIEVFVSAVATPGALIPLRATVDLNCGYQGDFGSRR